MNPIKFGQSQAERPFGSIEGALLITCRYLTVRVSKLNKRAEVAFAARAEVGNPTQCHSPMPVRPDAAMPIAIRREKWTITSIVPVLALGG
jgi:hypothetical protein